MRHAQRQRRFLRFAVVAVLVAACDPAPPPARRDSGPPGDAGPRDAGPRPDGGIDGGQDAGPCPGGALCAGACVDIDGDPAHCGGCDRSCTAPSDASATCVFGGCAFVCDAGFVREGAGCLAAPRPLWPPSLSTARTRRPTLRWVLPPGSTEATVELCADPACTSVHETLTVAGEESAPSAELPLGPLFWRVSASGRQGPTWRFDVAIGAGAADVAWGTTPDFNRDGYGDVVVAAPFAASSEGRVSIHLGGRSGTSAGASAVLRGLDGEGGELGIAVACAGDLDGDGYADLAAGSPGAGAVGRVWIFFGSAAGIPETGARMIALDGPSDGGSRFGGALAGAGDVDGDGYGDLVVGAVGTGSALGRMHLYRGRAGGVEDAPARSVPGVGRYASAVAGAGDLDGDGFADVAVGAPGSAPAPGEVHVFRGGTGGLGATPEWTLRGTIASGELGRALAGVGDLNGDGFADLAVGAPAANSSIGQVLVFYGSASGVSATADATVAGINAGGGFFGHSVAGFDGNGDGFDDLVVGAFGVNSRTGRVSVFLGSASGLVTTTRTSIEGPFGVDGDFGWAVASAGDVDANGRLDLVIGAPGVDERNGRAYVFRGAAGTGIGATPTVSLLGASGGAFGRAVASGVR